MRRPRFRTVALLSSAMLTISTARADDGPGKQEEKSFEKEITVTVKLNYLLYLPDGYDKSDKPFPLILFLHGAGESGQPLSKVKIARAAQDDRGGEVVPVHHRLAPEPRRRVERRRAERPARRRAVAKYRVDKDRVYLTGLSMGGGGTWTLAAAHPDRFAAIAPICGGHAHARGPQGDGGQAQGPAHLGLPRRQGPHGPHRALRGDGQRPEGPGADVKFTVYPEAKHDSWTETYNNPELYSWFLAHKRGAK